MLLALALATSLVAEPQAPAASGKVATPLVFKGATITVTKVERGVAEWVAPMFRSLPKDNPNRMTMAAKPGFELVVVHVKVKGTVPSGASFEPASVVDLGDGKTEKSALISITMATDNEFPFSVRPGSDLKAWHIGELAVPLEGVPGARGAK